MQYLKITPKTTLMDLNGLVGERNVDSILALNGLKRSPDIGAQFQRKCKQILAQTFSPVSNQTKETILNNFAGEGDIFEYASLMGQDDWKIMAALSTSSEMLKIPESIILPDSIDILGGTHVGVSSAVYKKAMESIRSKGNIDSEIFNDYNAARPALVGRSDTYIDVNKASLFQPFNLPWGKITLYSSLADRSIDFPVYPDGYSDERVANYNTMPDLIYQYEPWQVYTGSGPASKEFVFDFHRDMWTGDHRDGKANELVRFCQSCTYPEYNGSAVNSGTVTLYINGSPAITGIMTRCRPDWSGPIGLDGFYLVCKLTIAITEVSRFPLSASVVRGMSLIGD